jgi:hypothetical protein
MLGINAGILAAMAHSEARPLPHLPTPGPARPGLQQRRVILPMSVVTDLPLLVLVLPGPHEGGHTFGGRVRAALPGRPWRLLLASGHGASHGRRGFAGVHGAGAVQEGGCLPRPSLGGPGQPMACSWPGLAWPGGLVA